MEEQEHIQKKWNQQWGDRLNELVIIGQDLNNEKAYIALENCLLSPNEISFYNSGGIFIDTWPI